MPVIDIQDMGEYEATRLANPTAIIRLLRSSGGMRLLFPDDHGMTRFEVSP